ncbi:hypothetical protein V2J09_016961 [Rumex salicifolius]
MPNPNPNSSRTTHRRSSFPAPDPPKSSSITINPQSSASRTISGHFSKLGIGRRSSRARSPPPPGRHSNTVLESGLTGNQKSLSKSAIFEGKSNRSFSQFCPQVEQTTKRVVAETKRSGLEKSGGFNVKEKVVDTTMAKGGGVLVKPMLRLGRSRSLCDPKVELASFLVINGVKLVNADMPPFMQIHAVGCARKTCDSLEKFSSKALALSLKKEFDGAYGPAWHCIVGTSFGSFVTHSVGGFLYFSMDQKLHILLFKTTVARAK